MDALDEIENNNNRNLENVELVAAYMRTNAQRAAQRKAVAQSDTEPHLEAPRENEAEADKLDFSSEFTTGDMGLSSQGDSSQILNWKRQIEEEEEEEGRRKDDDEDQESAQEWQGGGWQEKETDSEDERAEAEEESPDELSEPASYVPSPSFVPRPVSPPRETLRPQPPPPAPAAATPATAPPPSAPLALRPPPAKTPNVVVDEVAEAQAFWGSDEPAKPVNPVPAQVAQATPPASYALPQRPRPAPQITLPSTGQAAEVEPNLAQLARNLIKNAAHEAGYEECVRLLSRFGAGALRLCAKEKVRVEILDEEGFGDHLALQSLGLTAEEIPADGAYLVDARLVLVDRRGLVAKPRFFHPALYYFAHAFDHAQGGETFSSRKAAAVVACFETSTRAHSGFDFVDELAAADPVRYFARSVAVYLGRDDCTDPLWSHQDLFDFDRPMYDYLQYLFARLDK